MVLIGIIMDSFLITVIRFITWLNIIKVPYYILYLSVWVYFSIIQRKVLTPNDFVCLEAVEERLLKFQKRYEIIAKPFEWKFNRGDLAKLMKVLSVKSGLLHKAA